MIILNNKLNRIFSSWIEWSQQYHNLSLVPYLIALKKSFKTRYLSYYNKMKKYTHLMKICKLICTVISRFCPQAKQFSLIMKPRLKILVTQVSFFYHLNFTISSNYSCSKELLYQMIKLINNADYLFSFLQVISKDKYL